MFRIWIAFAIVSACLMTCGCSSSHRDELIAQLNEACRELNLDERDWRSYPTIELEKNLEGLKALKRSMKLPSHWDDNEVTKNDPDGAFIVTYRPEKCIRCQSRDIRPYSFGGFAYEKAIRGDDSFIYGGGSIKGNWPQWGCKNCGARFYLSWSPEKKNRLVVF